MKKIVKIVFLIIFIFILLSIFSEVNAAPATITFNKKTATVGDTVTVTLSVKAATWNLHLSGSVTDSVVGYNSDAINQKITKKYSFKIKKAGTYNVSLNGDVTVVGKEKDTNQKINQTITINAKAKTKTSGTTSLTQKNKTNKTQTATKKENKKEEDKKVDKKEEKKEENKQEEKYLLKNLAIEGVELLPEFNSEVYDYTVKVADKEQLNINAKANQDSLIVNIEGNENLQYGENAVTINVKGQDDKEITTYNLKVIKEKSELTIAKERIQELEKENKTLKTVIIALIVFTVLISIISIVLIRKYKKM